jgi:hypothetical protein
MVPNVGVEPTRSRCRRDIQPSYASGMVRQERVKRPLPIYKKGILIAERLAVIGTS